MISPKSYCHIYGLQAYSLFLVFFLALLIPSTTYSQQLAFPTASGAGAYVTGGRGKPVYIVSNLNNSGSGSFRQALEDTRDTDGGIITFAVSGTIVLTSKLDFRNQDNITIAGQTAPAGGITIVGSNSAARFELQDMNNFIIRYVRFRPDYPAYPATEQDTFYLYNCSDYIIDHCSISWGTDENADSGNGNTYTWQRNLFAESNKTGMIMGAEVVDSYDMSFINNAFYNCSHRFPNWQSNGRVDVINNIIWGYRGLISSPIGTFNANHIGNYYEYFRESPTSETYKRMMYYYYGSQGNNMPSIYTSGNYVSDVLEDPNADNWLLWRWRFNPSNSIYSGAGNDSPMSTDLQSSNPFTLLGAPFEIKSYADAFADVTTNVGADARLDEYGAKIIEIDALDNIYLTNMQSQTLVAWTQDDVFDTPHRAAFLNSVSQTPINTHPANFDTNNDGIPDQWIINQGFEVTDDLTTYVWSSGYVGIEEYLNGVDFDTQGTTGSQVSVSANFETICEGAEAILTASGADSYVWDFNGGTSASITVSPITTTTYSVTGTHSDGSTTQDQITINVDSLPIANAGNDTETCQGTPVTLTATGGTSYQWSNGASTPSITVNPNVTTTYSVTASQNGCTSESDSVVVTVNEIPTLDAGPDETIFTGESVTLTATGADSYLWSTGETTQSITVNPILDTSYSVTGTSNTCESTDTVTVFLLDDSVAANAGSDMEICNGQTTTLTATGGITYLWDTGATTASIEVSPATTTTYTVTAFSLSGNNSEDDSVTVTVNEIPIADAGIDTEICFGNSTTLSASGGSSYLWSTGETSQSITVNPTETTTYSVEVFENNCSSTEQVTVTVNPLPNASAGSNVTIAEGESTTLTASGAITYIWNTGETTSSITVSPNSTTIYSVTGFNNGCESTDEVTVTVETENVTANAGVDVTICNGETTTLTASGGTTYLWNTGETTPSISVGPNATTTYTVTAFNAAQTTSDDANVTVTVNELPNTSAGSDITIIEGESTTLTATGAESYLWNTGETTSSISIIPNVTTTYTVTGFSNDCEFTDEVTVTVEPFEFTASAGADQVICQGYETTLTATEGDSYLWSTGETTQSITVNPANTQTYSVTVFQNGYEADAEVLVSVNPNPNVVIGNGDEIMILEGEFVTLSASGANSYVWNNGATQPNIAVSPSNTTTYEVTGYINNCEDTKSVIVNVFETVEAYAGEDLTICTEETAILTAEGGDEYLWNTGETTQSIEVAPDADTEYSVLVYNALDSDEATVVVYVEQCNIIETPPVSEDFGFIVYQEPTSDVLKVKINGLQNVTAKGISIYDMSGKILYTELFNPSEMQDQSQMTREINSSMYARGIYMVRLIYDDTSIIKKIPIR